MTEDEPRPYALSVPPATAPWWLSPAMVGLNLLARVSPRLSFAGFAWIATRLIVRHGATFSVGGHRRLGPAVPTAGLAPDGGEREDASAALPPGRVTKR